MKVVKGKGAKARCIEKIRSIFQKKSSEQFKREAEKLIKVNKKEYTPEFIQLVTELSNTGVISISATAKCANKFYAFLTGKKPDKMISNSTISRWNEEMARLLVCESLKVDKESRFFTYGIMTDESTRGESKILLVCFAYWDNKKEEPMMTLAKMKKIDRCTGFEVANVAYKTCNKYGFDPARCNFWLTDNAAYMSGLKSGAVVGFNIRSQANAFRIPCGIHSVHIAMTKFENETFGKLKPSAGLLVEHPSNLLNMAYNLHDGYKDSDRDSPMNMRSDTFKSLYWKLLQYSLKQYQRPISTRWQYQLKTGEQYLERREVHLQFATWFIPQLESSKNVLASYLKKWNLFKDWLQNPLLNLQVKCMVKFGKKFYAEVINFLTGFDNIPRVMQNDALVHLPPGNRAHELPDQVLLWLGELNEMSEFPNNYFAEEFEEVSSILHESELQDYSLRLKRGLKIALESFSKWMECWIYLPLSVCRLGGEHGPEFARAVASKILNHSFETELSWREKSYIEFLEEDLSKGIQKSFGLFEALNEDDFLEQFLAFAKSQASDLHKYPLVYDFVKYKIWSIVVHQQQLEGMFNKYDIKTDPNQKLSLQEARMQLTCSTDEKQVTGEMLKEIRREIREENERKDDKQEEFGEEAAKSVLESYVVFK
jgi:fumarate reductase subunit C